MPPPMSFVFRWKKRMMESPPVRLYRKDKKLAAFSNDVFETDLSQVNSLKFDSASVDIFSTNVNVGIDLQKHCLAHFSNKHIKDFGDHL